MNLEIPAFDIHGVVPPIRPGEAGHSTDRSPYPTDMLTFCQRFGDTPARRTILRGLLALREALSGAGIVEGFQWLDGSFTEDVERLRGRAPADIDVVTFCAFGDTPQQQRLVRAIPEAFSPAQAKAMYRVDHYFVQTDAQSDPAQASAELARWAAYWSSMWGHQRSTQQWKGFVSIPLDADDDRARAWLDLQASKEGGAQ